MSIAAKIAAKERLPRRFVRIVKIPSLLLGNDGELMPGTGPPGTDLPPDNENRGKALAVTRQIARVRVGSRLRNTRTPCSRLVRA